MSIFIKHRILENEGIPGQPLLPVYQKSAENNSCSEGHSQYESGSRRGGYRGLCQVRTSKKIEADGSNAQEIQL